MEIIPVAHSVYVGFRAAPAPVTAYASRQTPTTAPAYESRPAPAYESSLTQNSEIPPVFDSRIEILVDEMYI